MTLKFMQGFETMRDDSDFRAQGWPAVVKQPQVLVPSVTGVAGTSLKMLPPYVSSTSTPGSAGVTDAGFFNTGVTVNQAWLAGGFTLGFGGYFNSGVQATYGAGQAQNSNQICFDGTKYWAMRLSGSTWNVAFSTDLINWTIAAAQPATQLWGESTVSYLGGGIIAVVSNNTTGTALIVYYTSNNGASWSTSSLETVGNAQNGSSGVCIATGNATYPHAVITCSSASSAINCGGVYVGTIGGTMTKVATTTAASVLATARPRIVGTLVVMPLGVNGNAIYSATASNASLNTTGAWSTASFSGAGAASDIAYNPTSNLWVLATSTGIWTFPNTGSAGTPVAPTGAQTVTQRYSTVGMQNVFMVGSTMVALGLQGHIITSTDGITWTEAGSHILPVGTSGTDWRACVYDGSKYTMVSDANTGVIVTTPDFVAFSCQYVQDAAAAVPTNGFYDPGIYTGTAPDPSTGLWTCNNNMVNLQVNAVSGGTRSCYLVISSTVAWTPRNNIPATPLYNYWEIVGRSVVGTANSFTYALYLNGQLIASEATARPLATATTDTTSLMLIGLGRGGQMPAFDDMYFTLDDGVANTLQGPLGIVNMVARRPTTDVQAQWTKNGTAASNAQSVRQTALSQPTGNSVSSFTNGNKDIYSSTDLLPTTYTVKAVQTEAYISKQSTTIPTVNIGKISGGTEVDSPNKAVVSGSPTYVSQIFERDPNGNAAWSLTSAQNSQWALNKVS